MALDRAITVNDTTVNVTLLILVVHGVQMDGSRTSVLELV